ncbi:MAG: SHOCT domain-containing protein [Methanomassiliicoccales archaeon]|nr:SHOCT domain-containing protein [Methanomassiliicoccales archaeon]
MPEWRFQGVRRKGCVNAQDVLGGLWMAQMRALVGTIGGDSTLAAVTPFFRTTGSVGAVAVRKALGIEGNSFADVARATAFTLAFQDEGNLIRVYSNGLQIHDLEPCPYRGAPWELCWSRDHVMYKAFLSSFSNDLEPHFDHDVEDNTTNCVLTVTKGHRVSLQGEPLEEFTTEQVRESVPADVLSKFGVQYAGEFVANTVLAAKQALGEQWRSVLIPAGEHYGASLNQRITGATRLTGIDLASVGMVVEFVSSLLLQEGKEDWVQGTDWRKEITQCPFSSRPREVCEQLEAMYRGICCSMNPNLAFDHGSRMTEGHGSCMYHIGKGSGACHKDMSEVEEPLLSLKTRLARGEISEEDYLRLRQLLLE